MPKAYQIFTFIILFLTGSVEFNDSKGMGKILRDPATRSCSVQVEDTEGVSKDDANYTAKIIKKKFRARATEFYLPYVSSKFAERCLYYTCARSAPRDPQLNLSLKGSEERGPPTFL